MKHALPLILVFVLIASCSPAPAAATLIPPTWTVTSSPIPPTATFTPSPTPLPGEVVLPIDSLAKAIPWLPMDETARPVAHYVAFNCEIFHSGSEYNYGRFSNFEFDRLVNRAKQVRDPAQRRDLYTRAERLLCEAEQPVIYAEPGMS